MVWLFRFLIVFVVFVLKVGGVMVFYVFKQMKFFVFVEIIQVDVGIDIGDMFIGMYLKQVIVFV